LKRPRGPARVSHVKREPARGRGKAAKAAKAANFCRIPPPRPAATKPFRTSRLRPSHHYADQDTGVAGSGDPSAEGDL